MIKLRQALSHINIVFSGLFLILFVADKFNSAMGFISHDITKWLLCFFAISSMLLAIVNLVMIRRYDRTKQGME